MREDPEPADTSPAEDGATTSETDAAALDNAAAPSGDDDKKRRIQTLLLRVMQQTPMQQTPMPHLSKVSKKRALKKKLGQKANRRMSWMPPNREDDDAIAQAEARVDAARANANTTHEALVGVQLAIKEVLAVSTSNIDNAHEGGANADDLLTNLQNANKAAQKAIKLREQLKRAELATRQHRAHS